MINIRKVKNHPNGTYQVSIPIEMVREMKLENKKVEIKRHEKGLLLIIKNGI